MAPAVSAPAARPNASPGPPQPPPCQPPPCQPPPCQPPPCHPPPPPRQYASAGAGAATVAPSAPTVASTANVFLMRISLHSYRLITQNIFVGCSGTGFRCQEIVSAVTAWRPDDHPLGGSHKKSGS